MNWFKKAARKAIDSGKPTKHVAKFQESRSAKPPWADSYPGHQFEVDYGTQRKAGDKRALKCPSCGRVNLMEHGDRLLCGCNHLLELYGNGYDCWWNGVVGPSAKQSPYQGNYAKATQSDLGQTIMQRLTADPVIRETAEQHPSVKAALEQVEAMIALTKNIDVDTDS